MAGAFNQVWDLECFFKGGSSSSQFDHELDNLEKILKDLKALPLVEAIALLQEIERRLSEASSFVHCLLAQNVDDQRATLLEGRLQAMQAELSILSQGIDEKLLKLDDAAFSELIDGKYKEIAFILKEKRKLAKDKLPLTQETLIESLAVDGYHAWNAMYMSLCGKMRIEGLSIGQAENKMWEPDRSVRTHFFKKWKEAWQEKEDNYGQVLNHLGGYRLKVYEMRGWQDVLKEPLFVNRMQKKTLETMWKVIRDNKDIFIKYFQRKAKLLGIDKLSWHDVAAPLSSKKSTLIPYEEGAKMIIEQFERFSPKMAAFAKKALTEGWVEAEERGGKRAGGFCTHFPKTGQSRIFMTYNGTLNNLFTLAHELGHAYHSECVQHLPVFLQQYRMNVAETASTFAEAILIDSALKSANEPQEKIALLDDKISGAVSYLMNIYARFLFESNYYEARKKGMLLPTELSSIMEKAQKEAYGDALSEWHPHFWAAKMHFYFTDVPFYNFPYTFGYLFSLGIYAKGLKEGKGFAAKYDALLADSGRMETEELAKKHLGVDLSEKTFWQDSIDLVAKDVEEFLKISS